jgi:hypothetical protein
MIPCKALMAVASAYLSGITCFQKSSASIENCGSLVSIASGELRVGHTNGRLGRHVVRVSVRSRR